MKRFYERQDGMGYQEVITKEAELDVIGFDLIRLESGEYGRNLSFQSKS